jgi:Secretion system C-terminal sorting domain
MKRIFIFISILITFKTTIYSQKQGNIWCFGDSALIDFNEVDNPIVSRSASRSRGSCSSIADSLGNLLFYFSNVSAIGDTCAAYGEFAFMYTKEHTIMENGQCLSGEGWYEEHTIIPMPGNDSLYYKFSVNDYEHPGIDYSVIDMKANGGMGKVIERDVSMVAYTSEFGITPISQCIKAIRHGNGKDWWLISKTSPYNFELGPQIYFTLIKVTSEGITYEEVLAQEQYNVAGWGFNGFSNDGSKFYSIALDFAFGYITTYDFNRCTGEITNKKIIEETYQMQDLDSLGYYPSFWDAEMSPNNRYLYVNTVDISCGDSSRFFLFQYDLEAEFPALTRDTILDYYAGNAAFKRQGGTLRLAPDNKIYYSRPIENCFDYWWPYPDSLYHPFNMNLSVINNPDSAYPACNFTPYSFYLGGARTYYGLPNNPNFALGAVEGACDTSASGLNNTQKFLNTNLNIFPNPCYNNCQIQYKPATQKGNIIITNIAGKVIFKEENIPVTLLQHGYEINTAAFGKGVYFVTLVSGNQNVSTKMIKL